MAAGTYTENVTINRSVTINGATSGSTIVDGNAKGSVFTLRSAANVTLNWLTIQHGVAQQGSGIFANGPTLTLLNSTIRENQANREGGGIYSFISNLTIVNSTLANNTAIAGGGFYIQGANAAVTASTIANNSTTNGELSASYGAIVTLRNTIVGGGCSINPNKGAIVDGGHNLAGGGGCNVGPVTNLKLDPNGLQNNGGSTATIALLAGSPAIDAGDDAVCSAAPVNQVDQRGLAHPKGAHCDIGAYEANPTVKPVVTVSFTPNGQNGWFTTSPATGSVTAQGLASITGISCNNATVSNLTGIGTANASATVTVKNEGTTIVTCRATDSAGQSGFADNSPNQVTVRLDVNAPDTTLTAQPVNPTNSTAATFSFTGSDHASGVASYQCQVDSSAFTACTNPLTYNNLGEGAHTFQVRALDKVGNVDATPASFTWLVDLMLPDTTITAQPTNPTTGTSATFSFTGADTNGSGVASYQCQVDSGSFTACTSPFTYNTLTGGTHTFAVRATDAAGNVDATSATYTWTQCGDGIDAGDEAALNLALTACFKQRTTPGVFTVRMTGDITLTQTPIAENTNANISLLIDGQNHSWDGQGRDLHPLQVQPGTTVTVQNLNVRNASSSGYEAGGFYNQGTLTVDHSTIENNHSASVGGGIANYGVLTVRNSTIRNNYAYAYGGGIGNWAGTATVENTVISGNYAYFGGGLFNNSNATVKLTKALFGANTSASGGEVSNSYAGTINGSPIYVPTCYWLENDQNHQALTVPNNNNVQGTALVLSSKQNPTNSYQLWQLRADGALVSMPTGLLVDVRGAETASGTPAIVWPEKQPVAPNQYWDIPLYRDGHRTFASRLQGYYLSIAAQARPDQSPVVLRQPNDFRYNNWQNTGNQWWMTAAPVTDCLAAMPVKAASADSAPAITQIDAPGSPDQLPADAKAKLLEAMQPEPVLAAPSAPTSEQTGATNAAQTQRIFLPLVSR